LTGTPSKAEPFTASRRSRIAPFLAMDVLGAAGVLERAGRDIVHLEIGEPAAPAPHVAREAARAALEAGRIGYTEALGRPSLRARIARHYRDTYGVAVDEGRIVVTTGSSGGFVLAFLALFDPGARVAVSSPGYPAYLNIFQALGIEAVPIETGPASRYVVTAAMIEAEHARAPLQGVLLMSPANPSGTMLGAAELAAICATCQRLGIPFISDEIYHGLTWEAPAQTALAFSDDAVVVNSFSKYFCMTGWRIGWLVLPERLMRPVERLQQNLSISVPFLSQVAAEAAFDAAEELEAVKAGYARNRAILLEELPRLGLADFHPCDGAFYIYADIGHLTNDSLGFCKPLVRDTGVATAPGIDFDPVNGHRFIRFSFAVSTPEVEEALRRLTPWFAAQPQLTPAG
jgi:aspartate/methionine/tyrosine aminotransferase